MAWIQLGKAAIQALPAPRDATAIATINYNAAVARLPQGPLGVGEGHRDRRARDDVIRLINAGLVQRLFLECDDDHQTELDTAIAGNQQAADYLDTIADVVTTYQPMYDNPLWLGEVARAARSRPNPVPIHFVDTSCRSGTKWKPDKMTLRDLNAANSFRAITQATGTVGCLVLFGAQHFRGNDPPGAFSPNGTCLGQNLALEYVDYGPQ